MVKIMQNRDLQGRFANKSDSYRRVRSIRVTDEIWFKLGKLASQRSITRADSLEEMVKNIDLMSDSHHVINLLKEALKLKANAGGAIKRKIREVLLILDC